MTRDEATDGPLSAALRAHGLEPVPCPVLVECPPADREALQRVADALESWDWLVASSARAVHWLSAARGLRWPASLRAAAVGTATARALREHGVTDVLVGAGDGAEPLWTALAEAASWPGQRVLVLSTPGGRTLLADCLRERGADVTVVEAYRMLPRPLDAIAVDWTAADADAVVLASPRVAETLTDAVGVTTLSRCRVVAIGTTTAEALTALGLPHEIAAHASFAALAAQLAAPVGDAQRPEARGRIIAEPVS